MQGLCIDSNTVLHALSSVKLPIPDTQPTNMWTVALFAAARKPKFCSQSFAHVLQLLFVSYFSTIHTHPPLDFAQGLLRSFPMPLIANIGIRLPERCNDALLDKFQAARTET